MPRMTKQERELKAALKKIEDLTWQAETQRGRANRAEEQATNRKNELVELTDLLSRKDQELSMMADKIETHIRTATLQRVTIADLATKLAFAEGYIAAQGKSYMDSVAERDPKAIIDVGSATDDLSREEMQRAAVRAMQRARRPGAYGEGQQ